MKDIILDTVNRAGFRRVNVNVSNIYCNLGLYDEVCYLVITIDKDRIHDLTRGLIDNLLKSVEALVYNELKAKSYRSHFIIISSENVNVNSLFMPGESFWIADSYNMRLLAYEYEDGFYAPLRKYIEEAIDERNDYQEKTSYNGNDNRDDNRGFVKKTTSFFKSINIAPVTLILLFLNIIMFIATGVLSFTGNDFSYNLALSWDKVLNNHEYYRIITSMFVHSGISHLGNNMLILVIMGTYLENTIGSLSYGILYMLSGIVAGISSMGYNYMIHSEVVSVGASGAIFGVVGAMLFLILFYRSSIGNISTSQIVFMIIINLYAGFASANIDNAAHIGGFIGGFIICMLLQLSMKVTKYKKRI